MSRPRQPEMNIGTAGHVDHGKSTLVQALTGVWPERHSEELTRGITIKLGYANAEFRRCKNCNEPECFTTEKKCPIDGSPTELVRLVSLVDCPGHDALMAVMLAGSTIMDAAIMVIAANEPCPQPQTREHLLALKIMGVKDIVVVQNKIELVDDDKALENYNQIVKFLEDGWHEIPPIIPVSALHKANVDVLIHEMVKKFKVPERDLSKPPKMFISRSFDVNKPGTPIEDLKGGVLGGALLHGKLKLGDEIEILPGIRRGNTYQPLTTRVVSLMSEKTSLEEAGPGGLIAVGTELDPSLTKADALRGSVVGLAGKLPPAVSSIELEVHLMETVIGLREEKKVEPIRENEVLVLNIGTATTSARVTKVKGGKAELLLTIPACVEIGQRVAISRNIGGRFRLIGYGVISGV